MTGVVTINDVAVSTATNPGLLFQNDRVENSHSWQTKNKKGSFKKHLSKATQKPNKPIEVVFKPDEVPFCIENQRTAKPIIFLAAMIFIIPTVIVFTQTTSEQRSQWKDSPEINSLDTASNIHQFAKLIFALFR